jgi:hypothetical protein
MQWIGVKSVREEQEILHMAAHLLLQSEDHLVVAALFLFGAQKRASLFHLRINL